MPFLAAFFGPAQNFSDRFSDFSAVFRFRTFFGLSASIDFGPSYGDMARYSVYGKIGRISET